MKADPDPPQRLQCLNLPTAGIDGDQTSRLAVHPCGAMELLKLIPGTLHTSIDCHILRTGYSADYTDNEVVAHRDISCRLWT